MQNQAFLNPGPVMFAKNVVTADIPVDTAGYQEIANSGITVPLLASTGLGIATGAYNLTIVIDGTHTTTEVTLAAATIQGVIDAINTAIGADGTAALVSGRIRVTSATTGYVSSVAITDGVTNGLLAAINAGLIIDLATEAAVPGDVGVAGYQEISNDGTLTPLVGSTNLGIAVGTYNLTIVIDGTHTTTAVTLAAATVTGLINAINTAIGANGTASLTGGKIRVTSATTGASSSVAITDGVTNGLLAAITAFFGSLLDLATVSAVVGTEGGFSIQVIDVPPTDLDFMFIMEVRTISSGAEKVGFTTTYNKTTGLLTILDEASDLANGDRVTIFGTFGIVS